MNAAARFWAKVDIGAPDKCWEWQASCNPAGYGGFQFNGRFGKAHRAAWELANGPIPEGICVLHRCDNPPCCNPAHLWLGTYADNHRDAVAKGRIDPRKLGRLGGVARQRRTGLVPA